MNNKRLLWQERLEQARGAFAAERTRMSEREALYAGSHELHPVTDSDRRARPMKARHVHNIIAENIESEVSTAIPQPKVTAYREQDEPLAALIENMLRGELQRLNFAVMNDQAERTCPIQGGVLWLAEWDAEADRLDVHELHPLRVIPQDGVTGDLQEMDWIFLEIPETRRAIERRYGVDLSLEREQTPAARGSDQAADELLTRCVAYYRNDAGGIGRFSWVGETVLEDLEDFQARNLPVCTTCGAVQPEGEQSCPYCGSERFRREPIEFEELYEPLVTAHGSVIAGAVRELEGGAAIMEPVRVPFYRPTRYPLVLQKNVPLFGRFLGQSDVDSIADQQNTLNRLDRKIIDRICKAGTRITLPAKSDITLDGEDGEVWYLDSVADRNAIGAYDFKGDLEYELYYRANVEEQARKILGITESFQGRNDASARSGVAKQFAAQQAAGRLESKRVCKDAAYAELFRLMFELKLAYSDSPSEVVYQDARGRTVYDSFDRYDFLEQAEDGSWRWNDRFLFSTDPAGNLAGNREQMWREITEAFRAGSFGDISRPETLMLYWQKMEAQHYPGASETARYFKGVVEAAGGV